MLLPDRRCGASLLVSPVFDRLPRLRHGFSTLALGDATGHPPGGAALDRALSDDAASWTRHGLRQVHGAGIQAASPATASEAPPDGDALWTAERGQMLVIRVADCVPVLVAALGKGGVAAVAAVHAGWRGIVAGVVPAAVAALEAASPASRLVAVLGPSIGPCCFEIREDAAEPLRSLGHAPAITPSGDGTWRADLVALVRFQLAASGVASPVEAPPPCTRCHPELFPSHRRDGAAAPRMAAFIGLSTP